MSSTNTFRWYVVHVYHGFENKVAASIAEQAEKVGLTDHFEEVLVPSEDVVEVRRGAKVNTERKFFPGYILVKMKMADKAWHLVRSIPRVTGFLGSKDRPSPVGESEVVRIRQQVQEGLGQTKSIIAFEVGELVRVSEGPFATFSGVIEEVDEAKSRVKVAVSIFGRSTPVDLEYTQVEKM